MVSIKDKKFTVKYFNVSKNLNMVFLVDGT